MQLPFFVIEEKGILAVYKKVMKKYLGIILFMGYTIGFVLLLSYFGPEPKEPTQGIPHNYWVPKR